MQSIFQTKRTVLILVCSSMLGVVSCKKDKEPGPGPGGPERDTHNYAQLKPGNYWIYEVYAIDSSGNETLLPQLDSCYVSKDTVINGNTYFEMNRPGTLYPISYLRDSSNCIVDHLGKILFDPNDLNRSFPVFYEINQNDTIYRSTSRMTDKDLTVTTGAGTFITTTFQIKIETWPKWVRHFRVYHLNRRYAKNVGIVVEYGTVYLAAPTYQERRLLRYHVN